MDSQDRMLARLGEPAGGLPRARLRQVLESQSEAARALLDAEPCFEWRAVSHQELINEPAEAAAEIATFLGREEHLVEMAACVDRLLYRERRQHGERESG